MCIAGHRQLALIANVVPVKEYPLNKRRAYWTIRRLLKAGF